MKQEALTFETRRAARPGKSDVLNLRDRVLGLIRISDDGMTCDEVELVSGMTHQTASARVHELMRAGSIVATSKRATRSGRQAAVWKIARTCLCKLPDCWGLNNPACGLYRRPGRRGAP